MPFRAISPVYNMPFRAISCTFNLPYRVFLVTITFVVREAGMILKRKIYQKMLDWKTESKGTSVLMLDGARRVGKSYLCEQFGKNEYKSMILVDFGSIAKEMADIFENESSETLK